MPSNLKLTTPCCSRSVTPCRWMRYAVEVVERTCPKCKVCYTVRVSPIKIGPMSIHEVNWTAKS